ncbi:MAG: carbonic anhydrase [Chloroflexi bacterium]|nr:carbonic anhydrase [Chloroflexota bacterium]
MTPDEALQQLLDGNRRFSTGEPRHPHQEASHRQHLASGQHPFAVIVGCADSRVPPEIVFDLGLGDLFVVRSAGNIVDEAIIGSIEYAVHEFETPLIVVLGHESCGAVKAALSAVTEEEHTIGHIGAVVEAIVPAARRAIHHSGDWVDHAVRGNIEMVAATLRSSEPIITERVRRGSLKVLGARYDLDDGVVEVFDY